MLNVDRRDIRNHLNVGLIKVAMVYPITRKSHFRLLSPISVTLSNDAVLEIPSGYQFDGSSAPRFLWWLFPSYGDFFFAALIHDRLYYTGFLMDELGVDDARKFADEEMLYWSKIVNNRNFGKTIDNYLIYYAVRLFGKKIYIND